MPTQGYSKKHIKAINDILESSEDQEMGLSESTITKQPGDMAKLEAYLKALRDSSPHIRIEAIESLEKLGDTKAIEGILTATQDENAGVRIAASKALGQLGNKMAIEGLLNAVNHRNEYVRRKAIMALSQVVDKRALKALFDAEHDDNAEVREVAIAALRDLRSIMPLSESESLNLLNSANARDVTPETDETTSLRSSQKYEWSNLELPDKFIELLRNLAQNANLTESSVIRTGLVLVGLANRVKRQGFKLAVVDRDGTIIADVDGL